MTEITFATLDSHNRIPTDAFPPGFLQAFAGSAPPAGWLVADGSAVNRTTYSLLFSVVGTTYGVGDGSTTFELPDLRGSVPVGVDGSAGRLNNSDALGDRAGEERANLSYGNLPVSTMVDYDVAYPPGHSGGAPVIDYALANGSNHNVLHGAGIAHNNMPPYQVVNWLIKT